MLATVKSAFGGRAAEEIVFNKLTTGAYSDFQTATHIVRNMVCNYGMSDELGPLSMVKIKIMNIHKKLQKKLMQK